MVSKKVLQKYAKLAVVMGANVQPGQLLVINASVTDYEFVRMCVEEAYAAGAGEVAVEWSDERISLMTYQNCSVETLCESLHISPAYFSTIFKKEAGINFISYLTDVRMKEAMRLLDETDEKTYMIAAKVGYSEPNYFSYAFKKQVGVSPSRYRKGLRDQQ